MCYLIIFRFKKKLVTRTFYAVAIGYRTLQVLAVFMNEVQQKVLVTSIIFAGVPLTAFGLVFLIQTMQADADPVLLCLSIVVIPNGTLAMIALLGGMARLYSESEKCRNGFIHRLQSYAWSFKERKQWKTFGKSCSLIKVKFGKINFIERLTPLNCINSTSDLTMQLLLVGRT